MILRLLFISIMVALTGCQDHTTHKQDVGIIGEAREFTTSRGDFCVAYKNGYAGGLACDFRGQQ